jgi:hypothetical protein
MPTYVILMNWTDQGARNSRDTLERAQAFGATIQNRPPIRKQPESSPSSAKHPRP